MHLSSDAKCYHHNRTRRFSLGLATRAWNNPDTIRL